MSNTPNPNERVAEPNNQIRNAVIGIIVSLLVAIALLIGLAIFLALNATTAAPTVTVLRDLFIIVVALMLILIATAFAVLLVQVARFVNLLTNEIKPLIDTTSDTVHAVRGTAMFLSKHVTDPVIATAGTLGGIGKVVGDVEMLRKAAGIVLQAFISGSPTGTRASQSPGEAQSTPAPSETKETKQNTSGTQSKAPIRDNF